MAKDTELSSAFGKWPIDEFEENCGRDEIINPIEFGNVSLLDIADPEIEIQIETQKSGSLKKNRKERAPNEDIRLLQSYIKEVGQERLFTPKKEIETAAKIKSCEARVIVINAALEKLLGTNLEQRYKELTRENLKVVLNGGSKTKAAKRLITLIELYSKTVKALKARFIKANLRLVLIFTKRYLGRGLPLTDLIQEGNIGLMKAVDRFDHTRGFKFSTYASWWKNKGMSGAILDIPWFIHQEAY